MAEVTKTKTKAELDLEKQKSDESYYGGTLGAYKGDYAKDNFWMTKDSVVVLTPRGIKPARTMEKVAGDKLISEGEKVEGIIVYFLPKDKSGKLIGTPKRYLHIWKGGRTNKFIDADKVVPYYQDIVKNKAKWIGYGGADRVAQAESKLGIPSSTAIASNFTALDDAANELKTYGFNSDVDLSNMDGLDDSILNSISSKSNFYADNNYSNMINENLLDGLTENTSLLSANGDNGNDSEDSNMINENLLDGLTENTSLLSADGEYDDVRGTGWWQDFKDKWNSGQILSYANGDISLNADGEDEEEVSNAFGDWFKRVFKKKSDDTATAKLADPTVDIVEAEVMDKAYKESGSKKPLRDWINSDSGKSILTTAALLATAFLNKDNKATTTKTDAGGTEGGGTGGSTGGSTGGGTSNDDKEKEETTILGMTPVTFGIVAVGLIILTSIVAVKVIKSK